jgi:lipopolysaccharide/colanic/teichoic acid biosynthesis glycosyltransferase
MIKRAMDLGIATTGLTLLSPLLLLIALLIRFRMGGPVLFRQLRPGRNGRPFTLLKFRTMRPPSDPARALATDAERLTYLGRFLRRASLDELPELWNVIRGDMSLVGPRPLLMEYLPLYTTEQTRRHEVRPGITGWAQIHGRNAVTFEERFRLDVWYVDHASLWLDLRILVRTFLLVLSGEGVSEPGQATARPFDGRSTSDGS